MKKLIVTLVATVACLGAFAQGKISFQTDSLHLAYYTTDTGGGLAGIGVNTTAMPLGVTLVADLYMGTSSSALSLYTTTTFGTTPGKWNSVSVSSGFPGLTPPGGTVVFVEAQIRDQTFAAPATFQGNPFGTYYGASAEFQFTLGSSVTYPTMFGTAGNWPVGTFDMPAQSGVVAGSKGGIAVSAVPEPTSFALAGLGAAALLIFRRRK